LEAAIEKMNSANKRVKKAAQLNIKKIMAHYDSIY
jgi:hypothetical protein